MPPTCYRNMFVILPLPNAAARAPTSDVNILRMARYHRSRTSLPAYQPTTVRASACQPPF